jgi:hypothetical protein
VVLTLRCALLPLLLYPLLLLSEPRF